MGQEALDAETVRKFAEATERTIQLQERLGMSPVTGVSNATIAVNAGGVGVWIATTCCLVMLGMAVVGAFWLSREFHRIDTQLAEQRAEDSTLRTYLSSIWQQAPQLKPKEEEKEDASR
jgi:hypothetical protein